MSQLYPCEITSEDMTIRFESAEDAQRWLRDELRAWQWIYAVDESVRHRFRDLIVRASAMREPLDLIGRATYLGKQEPDKESEREQALRDSVAKLQQYPLSFPLSQSGAGLTIRRIAARDPAQALMALHTYLGLNNDSPPTPDILWHYTTVPALLGILENATLWGSDTRFLNDSTEVSYAAKLLDKMLDYKGHWWGFSRPEGADPEFWDITRRSLPEKGHSRIQRQMLLHRGGMRIFTTSFCEGENLLSQWRGYGSRQPIAIGFDMQELKAAAAAQGGTLERCIYEPWQQKKMVEATLKGHLQKFFDDAFQKPEIDPETKDSHFDKLALAAVSTFSPLMPICKHPDFREEREWRVIIRRPSSSQEADSVHGHQTATGMAPRFHIKLSKPTPAKVYLPPDQRPPQLIKDIVVGPGPSQQATHEALTIKLRELWPGLNEPKISETPYVQQ